MTVWPNGSQSIPRVTSEYGPRTPIQTPNGTTSNFHTGIDLVGFSEVRAVQAGTIIAAGYSASSGNEVKVQHADGAITRYFHLARFIRTGGSVAEGEVIGIMGMTGMATGVHLHFRTDWPLGTHHQPRDYMAARLTPAQTEADKARVRRNAAYLNTLGLGPRSGAEDDGIPIDPPITSKTVSKYYNLVQKWADSRGIWHDSFGPPYLTNTKAAEAALDAFLDNPPPVMFTVTFDSKVEGSTPTAVAVEKGKVVTAPAEPILTGYNFAGWYDVAVAGSTVSFDFATPITGNVVLAALWTPILLSVDFVTDSGSSGTFVEYGSTVDRPEDPSRPGFEFLGWTVGDDLPFDFARPIIEETTFTPLWRELPVVMHTVTFLDGETNISVQVKDGQPVPNPGSPVASEGWVFDGWYYDEAEADHPFDFTSPITEDTSLTARYSKKPEVPPVTTPPKFPGMSVILGTLGVVVIAILGAVFGLGS